MSYFAHSARAIRRGIPLLFLLAGITLCSVNPAEAQIDPGILKKTKEGTVHLLVKLVDGRTLQGTGFCIEEPGLIVTNARVLGMMDADSRKPSQVDVALGGDGPGSRVVKAKVLGVDRGTDLAMLRMEGKDLPAPLKLGVTSTLKETDPVFVFGHPFGKELGKAITVSKSSVSSLRKNKADRLEKIQLEGGLNPGNSGGPIIDAAGGVVGVAVSKVSNSAVGFAIPAEDVVRFMNGRMNVSVYETPYKDGNKIVLPMRLDFIDPIGRVKKASVEIWTGNAGPNRPAGSKQPEPVAGDSPISKFDFKPAKDQSAYLDVPLPPLTDPKQVYYYRPVITNGSNETRWVAGIPIRLRTPVDRIPVELAYAPPEKQTAELTSKGSFRIREANGEENTLSVDFRTTLTETYREKQARLIPMRLSYNSFSLNIKKDEQRHPAMDSVVKMIPDVRFLAAEVEMDPDGSMGRSKEDLTRVPAGSRGFLSDISDQALQSLEVLTVPLPAKKLQPMETWKAQRNFMVGNAFLIVPASVDITYKFIGVQKEKGKADGKDVALIGVEGDVRSRRGSGGPDVTGTFRSLAYISLETGEVLSSNGTVKAEMDIPARGKSTALKVIATMSVSITRPAPPPVKKEVPKGEPKM